MAPAKLKPDTSRYYKFNRILSYNAQYNFITGARGIGKTYGAKRKVILDNIKNGDEFIYLRRYATELKTAMPTFFDDIAIEFKEWEFRVNGTRIERASIESAGQKGRDWVLIGWAFALSKSQTLKSMPFPRVKTIIYDEFIIENGVLHYLPDEFNIFNNFYSTIDRYKDKTRVLFLANSVSITNPYFIGLDIRPDLLELERDMIVLNEGFVACHFPDSKYFKSLVMETRFGKFIEGTEYAAYAVGNQFADAGNALVVPKPSTASYQFTLETKAQTISLWRDIPSSSWYAQRQLPKSQVIFTLVAHKMDTGKTLLHYSDPLLQAVRHAFNNGKMMFDSPGTRNAFIEVYKR